MIDGPTLQIPAVRHAHHDRRAERIGGPPAYGRELVAELMIDRKSTRLNSSHPSISYAVFCLKKKKTLFSVAPGPYRAHEAEAMLNGERPSEPMIEEVVMYTVE